MIQQRFEVEFGTHHPFLRCNFVQIYHRTSFKCVFMLREYILIPEIEWEQVVRKGIADKMNLLFENGFRSLSVHLGRSKKTLL